MKLNYNWTNVLFLVMTPLVAAIGFGLHVYYEGFNPHVLWVMVLLLIPTSLSVTAGYHRLFSHRAYQVRSWVKALFLFFGAAAFENSALAWCSDHRRHHSHVDTDKDPYNIKRGFFFAHMGWIFYDDPDQLQNRQSFEDLKNDPLVAFQDRYYLLIATLVGLIIPTAIGFAMGSPIGGIAILGFLKTVLIHHSTFLINSYCHMFGTQTYTDQNSARDSHFIALFTFGEGLHNFHHSFQGDYRNGFRWYHVDPTKWLILGLYKLGLAYDLKRANDFQVLRSKLAMDQKRILSKLQKKQIVHVDTHERLIEAARIRLEETYQEFLRLKGEYQRLRQEMIPAHSRAVINEWKTQLKFAKYEMKRAQSDFRLFYKMALASA